MAQVDDLKAVILGIAGDQSTLKGLIDSLEAKNAASSVDLSSEISQLQSVHAAFGSLVSAANNVGQVTPVSVAPEVSTASTPVVVQPEVAPTPTPSSTPTPTPTPTPAPGASTAPAAGSTTTAAATPTGGTPSNPAVG